jgi:chromosome segregation ATPase
MNKAKEFINKYKKAIMITLSALLLISFVGMGVLGYFLFTTNQKLNSTSNDLTETKSVLSTTEENLKVTTDAKVAVEAQNAELTANKTKLEADINAKQAELASANANLAGAQKCVTLFDSVKVQLNAYNSNLEKSGELVLQAIEAAANGDNARADQLISQAISFSNKAQANLNTMNSTFTKVKSGKC